MIKFIHLKNGVPPWTRLRKNVHPVIAADVSQGGDTPDIWGEEKDFPGHSLFLSSDQIPYLLHASVSPSAK